jgi:membrane-associated protease RseP (regulator of RpoE activity)
VTISRRLLIPIVVVAAGLLVLTGALAAIVITGDDDDGGARPAPTVGPAQAYLGVSVSLGAFSGLRVASVDPAGPAAAAGLQSGDVIRSVDGRVVRTPEQLRSAITSRSPGDTVIITYERGDQESRTEVRLTAAPAGALQIEPSPAAPAPGAGGLGGGAGRGPQLGVQVQPITPALRQQYGLGRDTGVVVTGVTPNSPAARAGLQPGDVILRVEETPVSTVADLQRALLRALAGRSLEIRLLRGSEELTVQAQGIGLLQGLEGLSPELQERLRELLGSGVLSPEQLQRLMSQLQSGTGTRFGTVKSVSPTEIVIEQPFGAEARYALNDQTRVVRGGLAQGQSGQVQAGETVIVISMDGQTAAAVISLGRLPGLQR